MTRSTVRWRRWLLGGGLLLVIGLPCLALPDFLRRMGPSPGNTLPQNAVVFTGQFERVRAGLSLLGQGQVVRLFVSGVNPGAGMRADRFAAQFAFDDRMRAALIEGRLVLGSQAQNTLQNATEAACWYQSRGLQGPLLLITSGPHMPRASLALEIALPNVTIYRLPVSTDDTDWQVWLEEFSKYLATRLLSAAPRSFKALDVAQACDPNEALRN